MSALTAAMPYIVDQVDRGKAGWDTKARLLTIVAWRTSIPGSWTWIDRAVLAAEHQRTGWEARWDVEVLDELAGPRYRILRRAPHSPLWRLAGDDLDAMLRWRHVPWIGSRRAAHTAVRRCVGVAKVAVGAGQTMFPMAGDTRYGHLGDLDLSVKHPPVPPQQPPPAPHTEPVTSTDAAATADPATPERTPSPLSGLLRNPSLSQASEGGSEQLADRLRQRLIEVLGVPFITGSLWERCQSIASLHAHAGDALIARCDAFAGTRSVRLALDALEAFPLGEAVSSERLSDQLDRLRRLHATWVGLEELDRAAEASAEIDRIESLLGTRPGL